MTVVRVTPLLGVRALGRESFDYLVPPEWEDRVGVGALVAAPFGRRAVDGVVTGLGPSGDVPLEKLRPIRGVAPRPLPGPLIELAGAVSRHYLAPLGACLQAVVPAHRLASKVRAPSRAVAWVAPADTPPDAGPDAGRRPTARQAEVLAALPPEGMPVAGLLRATGASASVVQALEAGGRVVRWLGPPAAPAGSSGRAALPASPPAGSIPGTPTAPPVLTPDQEDAVALLQDVLSSGVYGERLLWGVTGSGKTEVYLRLIERVLDDGGGALVLVPEIALTVRAVERLRARLGETVAVLHSALPAGERAREYERVAEGTARVVVGARSAVFAPVHDLRLIVLDEAHDSSYKQEDEPRYDARWVARWLARRCGAVVLEGTASPTVEAMRPGRAPIELRSRPGNARLPVVEVVDMRRQGGETVLAARSAAALREVVAKGEQAVVLLNRRGYAAFLLCEECGHVVMCPSCEISLTYHRSVRALLCHHCGLRVPAPAVCPECGGAALRRGSPGTEKVVEELRRLVPRDRLFRLDSDVVTSGGRVADILAGFAGSSPGVLVGTQMVAKGHDYPLVTLVVVADADTGLYAPDFRASERTFQLLTQVAGRAGRADRPGRVLVQTWNPEVDCVRLAVVRDAPSFYGGELAVRAHLGYPPFRELVRLVLSGTAEERVDAGAAHLTGKLRSYLDDVRGPARLPRIRGLSRRQILVVDEDGERARGLVGRALERYRRPYAQRGLDIVVDVDPQWFT